MCGNIQKIGAVGPTQRGFKTIVEPVFGKSLKDVPCVNCGQCITVCPVGALTERSEINNVWNAIHDKTKHVVVQTAPAVRFGLGEEFGIPVGASVTGDSHCAQASGLRQDIRRGLLCGPYHHGRRHRAD